MAKGYVLSFGMSIQTVFSLAYYDATKTLISIK